MNKKISDKDKKDWQNFISNKKKLPNKDLNLRNNQNKNNIMEVTVDFVSEIISCVKDKDNKILSGDPEKVKKVFDTWKFSKNSKSNNQNWLLIDTQI